MTPPIAYHPKHSEWARFNDQLQNIKSRGFPVSFSGEKGVGKEFSARIIGSALGLSAEHIVWLAPESLDAQDLAKIKSAKMVVFTQHSSVPVDRQEEILNLLKSRKGSLQVVWISPSNLGRQLESGTMSEDLFYGLNIFEFQYPELVNMPQDIEGFSNHFLAALCAEAGMSAFKLVPEQVRLLRKQSWLANLDSLQFILKRSLALSSASRFELDISALPRVVRTEVAEDPEDLSAEDTVSGVQVDRLEKSVNEFKRKLVMETLKKAGGNKSQAAKLLGVSKAYVFRLIHMLDIQLD